MDELKINERITFLRKQKCVTQEELAQILGVTNQSVSKWESGVCCPDIQLLPSIAHYFNVSIDELMGYKSLNTFEDVYFKVKSFFEESPKEDAFSIAFRLSVLLHEGAVTKGYKGYVPWDTNKNHGLTEDGYKWGFSACSEPEGITVYRANAIFIADNRIAQPITPAIIREIHFVLENFCEINTLKVFFMFYEMTVNDFNVYISADELAAKCKLSKETVQSALNKLPVCMKDMENDETLYRIEGHCMHIPAILRILYQS